MSRTALVMSVVPPVSKLSNLAITLALLSGSNASSRFLLSSSRIAFRVPFSGSGYAGRGLVDHLDGLCQARVDALLERAESLLDDCRVDRDSLLAPPR